MGWIIAAVLGYLLWQEKNETMVWKNAYSRQCGETDKMRGLLRKQISSRDELHDRNS